MPTMADRIMVTTWPRPRSLKTPNTDMGAVGWMMTHPSRMRPQRGSVRLSRGPPGALSAMGGFSFPRGGEKRAAIIADLDRWGTSRRLSSPWASGSATSCNVALMRDLLRRIVHAQPAVEAWVADLHAKSAAASARPTGAGLTRLGEYFPPGGLGGARGGVGGG